MRPRRNNAPVGSLDSLLDTMTNVVGILIIVLVITQIKMSDAVRRVQSNLPEISADQLKELQDKWAALEKNVPDIDREKKQLEAQLAAAEKAAQEAKVRIPEIEQQLVELKEEQLAAQQADELKKQLAAQEKKKSEKTEQMLAIRKEMEQLVLQLKNTPIPKNVPARVVRLPDPKTAPTGAQPRYFICRFGRIYYVDEGELRDTLEKALARARNNLEYKDPKTRKPIDKKVVYYDWEKVAPYFERFTIGTREFRFAAQRSGDKWNRNLYYTLAPSPFSGETASRIAGPTSRFRTLMNRKLSNENVYTLFLVYPDSFDVYLKAREVMEEYDVPAGWLVQSTNPKWFWSPHKLYRKETHGKTRPPPANPPAPRKPNLLID